MSNNYHININPREPSRQDIEAHKDFDGLLELYHKEGELRPKSKTGRIRKLAYTWGAAAAVIAGIVFGITLFFDREPSMTAEEYFAARPFVNPSIVPIADEFTEFQINANQGGVYEYESGSRLVIPAAAFMDDRGRFIEGEVDVRYREMHDYVDFFLAGVPMVYDSAGLTYNFESAGMVEIYAEQNGKRVNIAPGKEIQVELVSEIIIPNVNVSPRYNIYRLDTVSRNWIYQDVDQIQVLEDEVLDEADPLYPMKKDLVERISKIEAQAKAKLENIEASIPRPEKPLPPQRKNGNNPSLELDFLEDNISFEGTESDELELESQYKGTIWQISPQSRPYQDEDLAKAWESVRLKKINTREYALTLSSEDSELQLIVNPVLTGEDYEEAVRQFEEEYAAYENAVQVRESQLKARKEALKKKVEAEKAAAQQAFEERLEALRERGLEYAATQEIIKRKVINRFKATDFGIWNCDRLLPPFMNSVKGKFVDQNGRRLNNRPAYLVDKSRNTVCRLLATKNAVVRFNADSENLLWLITEENKIAVFRPEDFRKINPKKNDHTFVMQVIDEPIGNERELRRILEF